MRTYEAITVVYFLLLAVAAPFTRVPGWRRAFGACTAVIAAGATVAAVQSAAASARAWLPLVYIATGYWVPVLLTRHRRVPHAKEMALCSPIRFEGWLLCTDSWLRNRLPRVPVAATAGVELAYLACYPLVPLGFAAVFSRGTTADIDRFWTVVLLSGFACYGTLPWLESRPPRLLVPPPVTPRAVARVNRLVLDHVSHGWNTFPSGHAAMSFAVALSLMPVSMVSAGAAGIVATAVSVGAAAGRYHYVIDVLLGAVVALASAVMFGSVAAVVSDVVSTLPAVGT